MELQTKFKLPSGKEVTIREPNGDDDALLSRIADIMTGDNFTNYISSIVLLDSDLDTKPNPENVEGWKTNDRFAFLFKQRIWVYGPELEYDHICNNPDCENHKSNTIITGNENLEKYDTKFEELNGNTDAYFKANPDKMITYKNGKADTYEFEVDGLGKFRFKYLTTKLEKQYNKQVMVNDRNSNTLLLNRNLERFTAGEWRKVTFFQDISSRKMVIIRKHISEADSQWSPAINWVCPNCGQTDILNIFMLPGFYFPEVKI